MGNESDRTKIKCYIALLEAKIPTNFEILQKHQRDELIEDLKQKQAVARSHIVVTLLNDKNENTARRYLNRCENELAQYLSGEKVSKHNKELILEAAAVFEMDEASLAAKKDETDENNMSRYFSPAERKASNREIDGTLNVVRQNIQEIFKNLKRK